MRRAALHRPGVLASQRPAVLASHEAAIAMIEHALSTR